MFANWSIWFEDESFWLSHPFVFSNFLIITSSPNFSFKISCASPMPSINPNFLALEPDQNSPENNSTSVLFNFAPRLFSTTFMKSGVNLIEYF